MTLNLLSILNRAPQIISGKPEEIHADALAAVPLSSTFSDQLNQKLAAQNSHDIKAELLVAQAAALAQPIAAVVAPVDATAFANVAQQVVATDENPDEVLLFADVVQEFTSDDIYLNVSTDEVLEHTGKLATQTLADDTQVTLQLGEDGQVISEFVAAEDNVKLLQTEDEIATIINATPIAVADVIQDNPAIAALTQLLPQPKEVIDEEELASADDEALSVDENSVVVPLFAPQPIEQAVTAFAVPLTIAFVPAPQSDLPAIDTDADIDLDVPLITQKPLLQTRVSSDDDSAQSPIDRKELEAVVQRVLAGRADAQTNPASESFEKILAAADNSRAPQVAFDAASEVTQGRLSSADAPPVLSSGAIESSVGLSVASQERASNILTLKASTFATNDKATPADQVKVSIRQAIRAGVDRVTITLEPEELGRVDVKIDIHKNGANHIVFTADNRFALEAIQRDVKQLEQALHNSGLGTEGNTMEFNLSQRRDSQDDQPQDSGYGTLDNETGADIATINPVNSYYTVTVSEGLDIKV